MGKSISKAFKKVVGGTLGAIGLTQSAPTPSAAEVPVAAAPTDVPPEQVTDVETEVTDTDKKKVKSAGKRGLQVTRSSGNGISL